MITMMSNMSKTTKCLHSGLLLSIPVAFLLCFHVSDASADADTPVLSSNGHHCADIEALADFLDAGGDWSSGDDHVRLSRGDTWIVIYAGSVLAETSDGRCVLPTCPLPRDDVFYIPTETAVAMFGDSLDVAGGMVEVHYGDATLTLPQAVVPEPPEGEIDLIVYDLSDPAVPVELYTDGVPVFQEVHRALMILQDTLGPASSILSALLASPLMDIIRVRAPGFADLIESAAEMSQMASEQISEYADTDEQQTEPILEALDAAYQTIQDPTVETVRQSRVEWDQGDAGVVNLLNQTSELESTIRHTRMLFELLWEYRRPAWVNFGGVEDIAYDAVIEASVQALVVLEARRWHLEEFREYFMRAMDDSTDL